MYKSFIVNMKEAQSCLERVSKEKSVASFLKVCTQPLSEITKYSCWFPQNHEKNGLTLAELLKAPICRIEDYLVILTVCFKLSYMTATICPERVIDPFSSPRNSIIWNQCIRMPLVQQRPLTCFLAYWTQ